MRIQAINLRPGDVLTITRETVLIRKPSDTFVWLSLRGEDGESRAMTYAKDAWVEVERTA
jgi:hypothetical protein